VAEPFDRASDEVTVVPSTIMVKVPVGVVVLELESEATLIVMVSLVPGAGVVVAVERVVFEATPDDEDVGHAVSRL